MTEAYKQQVIDVLLPFVSDNKKEVFEACLRERTRYLTVVLEDIYQPQNTSAVLRTCDCFGLQDVYVIENDHAYDINPNVVKGATKWLHIHKYYEEEHNSQRCLTDLKDKGYLLVATSPSAKSVELHNLPLDKPIALMLGTEKHGLSKVALEMADVCITIPMSGFTESLNLSVSGGICIQNIMHRIRQSDVHWQLSEAEKLDLHLEWVRKVVKDPGAIERRMLGQNQEKI
jgi:tRNA (guanosine-2'-O-)-methyltransferase